MVFYPNLSKSANIKTPLAIHKSMSGCGSGVVRKARIFYSDGRSDLAKKIDALVLEMSNGFVRFIDTKTGMEMAIPMDKIYRMVFFEEGKDGSGMA